MTIRPLSLLTAGLFFLGGFLLVLPTQPGRRGDSPVGETSSLSESALSGISDMDPELLLQGEDGGLLSQPQASPAAPNDARSSRDTDLMPRGEDTVLPSTGLPSTGLPSIGLPPIGKRSTREPSTGSGRSDKLSREERGAAPRTRAESGIRQGRSNGRLRGRIVWERSRQPVSGVGMRIYVRIDGEDSSEVTSAEELEGPGSAFLLIGEGLCNGKGEFELESRASQGQLCLVISVGEDKVGVFSLSMAPKRGEIFDLGDLDLEETGKAVGRVLDAEGKPVKNAWVRVASTDTLMDYELDGLLLIREPEQRIVSVPDWVRESSQSAGPGRSRTDDQGFFQVDRVTAGPGTISVQADQHLPHRAPVEVVAGQTSDLGSISMGDGGVLGGQLLDQRGLPVREAQVSVGSSGRSLVIPKLQAHVMSRPVFTDEEGRFRVAGLADGELFVAWRPSSDFDWQVLGPLVAEENLKLRVQSPFLAPAPRSENGIPEMGVPDGALPDGSLPDGAPTRPGR